MKFSGRLIDITLDESARTRLFLISLELALLAEEGTALAWPQKMSGHHYYEASSSLHDKQDMQIMYEVKNIVPGLPRSICF